MPASSSSILPSAARPGGHAGSSQRRSTASPSTSSTTKSRQFPVVPESSLTCLLQQKRNRHRQQRIQLQTSPQLKMPNERRRQRIGHTQQAPGQPGAGFAARTAQVCQQSKGKNPARQHRRQQKNRRDHYVRPQNDCQIHCGLSGLPSATPSPAGTSHVSSSVNSSPPTVNFSHTGACDGEKNPSRHPATTSIGITPDTSCVASMPPCATDSFQRYPPGKQHRVPDAKPRTARDDDRRQFQRPVRRDKAPQRHDMPY